MKHIKTYSQLNESETSRDKVNAAESFLEDFITSLSEDDDYGSMSFTTDSNPAEGEYILDNEKNMEDGYNVWVEFKPTKRTFEKLKHDLETDYNKCDLVVKFEKKVKEKGWDATVANTSDTIILSVEGVN